MSGSDLFREKQSKIRLLGNLFHEFPCEHIGSRNSILFGESGYGKTIEFFNFMKKNTKRKIIYFGDRMEYPLFLETIDINESYNHVVMNSNEFEDVLNNGGISEFKHAKHILVLDNERPPRIKYPLSDFFVIIDNTPYDRTNLLYYIKDSCNGFSIAFREASNLISHLDEVDELLFFHMGEEVKKLISDQDLIDRINTLQVGEKICLLNMGDYNE